MTQGNNIASGNTSSCGCRRGQKGKDNPIRIHGYCNGRPGWTVKV